MVTRLPATFPEAFTALTCPLCLAHIATYPHVAGMGEFAFAEAQAHLDECPEVPRERPRRSSLPRRIADALNRSADRRSR